MRTETEIADFRHQIEKLRADCMEFERMIAPLTKIIDAVFVIRLPMAEPGDPDPFRFYYLSANETRLDLESLA
jgi:hypothetical protein